MINRKSIIVSQTYNFTQYYVPEQGSAWDRDRVPDFFGPRDSLEELSPGIPRPTNPGPGPCPGSLIF